MAEGGKQLHKHTRREQGASRLHPRRSSPGGCGSHLPAPAGPLRQQWAGWARFHFYFFRELTRRYSHSCRKEVNEKLETDPRPRLIRGSHGQRKWERRLPPEAGAAGSDAGGARSSGTSGPVSPHRGEASARTVGPRGVLPSPHAFPTSEPGNSTEPSGLEELCGTGALENTGGRGGHGSGQSCPASSGQVVIPAGPTRV